MTTTLTTHSVLDAIREEHRKLDELYARIRETLSGQKRGMANVQVLFDELVKTVRRHFEHEEEGGYFREIIEMAPRLSSRADRLEEEHTELLKLAEHLAMNIRHSRDTQLWRFATRVDFEYFIHRCEDHESAETALVQDAYLQDIGALD